MSAVILNIAVSPITSVISGASVWAWDRARVTRRQRERARFFGLSPGYGHNMTELAADVTASAFTASTAGKQAAPDTIT